MALSFTDDNGSIQFERIQDILVDTTDGYLSNKKGVTYRPDKSSPLSQLIGDGVDEEEVQEVGSRLLKSLSNLHSIVMDYTIKDKDAEYVIHRMSKLTGEISKLSDSYSMKDSTYSRNYHDDIIAICEAINRKA